MRQKCPAELNSKTIRINIGDYTLLAEISRRAGVTFAEAFHLVIAQQGQVIKVSSAQPAFRVTGMPEFRVTGMPVLRVAPVTVTAVNGAGAKHSAYVIKPKGGVIHE
jgi:hypothetical protein